MNRWYQIRRLRGAAWLILIGILALLNQWHILRWSKSWPLFLIVPGVLMLVERAAWTADVRDQQAAQAYNSTVGQPMPPHPQDASYWGAPPAATEPQPFIQTHPPAPEDPNRPEDPRGEDR